MSDGTEGPTGHKGAAGLPGDMNHLRQQYRDLPGSDTIRRFGVDANKAELFELVWDSIPALINAVEGMSQREANRNKGSAKKMHGGTLVYTLTANDEVIFPSLEAYQGELDNAFKAEVYRLTAGLENSTAIHKVVEDWANEYKLAEEMSRNPLVAVKKLIDNLKVVLLEVKP